MIIAVGVSNQTINNLITNFNVSLLCCIQYKFQNINHLIETPCSKLTESIPIAKIMAINWSRTKGDRQQHHQHQQHEEQEEELPYYLMSLQL